MRFLNDLGLTGLFLLLFIGVFFIFQRIIEWNKYVKLNLAKQTTDFLFGSFMGIIILLIELLNKRIHDDFNINLFVIGSILLLIFRNYIVALYSILPQLAYDAIFYKSEGIVYSVWISFFVLLIIVELIWSLTLDWKRRMIWVPFAIIVGLISWIVVRFRFFIDGDYYLIQISLLTYLFAIFSYLVMSWIIRFTISSKVLFESSNYIFGRFYRYSLMKNAVSSYIAAEKPRRGFLGLFSINFNYKSEDQKREIEETILEKIGQFFPDDAILFDATNDNYGFFIKANKYSKNQELRARQYIQSLFFTLPNRLLTTWDREVDVEIKVGVSNYGTMSNSISKLLENSQFALETGNEKINIFNYSKYKKIVNDNFLLTQMDDTLQLDNYAIKFFNVINLQNLSDFGIVGKVDNISEYSFNEDIEEIVNYKGWREIFDRYIASSMLKATPKSVRKIFIKYSPKIIAQINSDSLIEAITSYGFLPSQIIFVIDHNQKSSLSKCKSNVMKLKSHGIEFAGYLRDYVWFDYLIIFESELSDYDLIAKQKKPLIVLDISSESSLLKAKNLNIVFGAGDLIKSDYKYGIFDKQSKMYIENILEEKEVRKWP